jgi:hypothetical protein
MTRKTREVQVVQEVVESITCDFCGITHYEDDNVCLENLFCDSLPALSGEASCFIAVARMS